MRCNNNRTKIKYGWDTLSRVSETKLHFFLGDFAAKNNEQDLALLARVETNAEVSSSIRK